jgi:hypothetical protein
METSGQLHALAALFLMKETQYRLDRRLDVPPDRSRRLAIPPLYNSVQYLIIVESYNQKLGFHVVFILQDTKTTKVNA